jgi:hypothetical protein
MGSGKWGVEFTVPKRGAARVPTRLTRLSFAFEL